MAQQHLKKELYQLMAGSMAIQSLGMKERLEMQDKMLALPEPEMRRMIQVFRDEHVELLELQKRSLRERKEIKKIETAADGLRDAGRRLDKAFLTARESEERSESSRISSGLLDEIDSL